MIMQKKKTNTAESPVDGPTAYNKSEKGSSTTCTCFKDEKQIKQNDAKILKIIVREKVLLTPLSKC